MIDTPRLRPSNLGALELCPGRLAAEQAVPPGLLAYIADGEDAERGRAIHDQLARIVRGHLVVDKDRVTELCERWIPPPAAGGAENRAEVSLTASSDVPPGTADVVTTWPNGSVTLTDWKTGRCAVPPAGENLQLAAYAEHLFAAGCRSVTARIVQPLVKGGCTEVTWTRGSRDHWRLLDRISRITEAVQKPDAPRNPGPACRFCTAILVCPAVRPGATGEWTPAEVEAARDHVKREDRDDIKGAMLGCFARLRQGVRDER